MSEQDGWKQIATNVKETVQGFYGNVYENNEGKMVMVAGDAANNVDIVDSNGASKGAPIQEHTIDSTTIPTGNQDRNSIQGTINEVEKYVGRRGTARTGQI